MIGMNELIIYCLEAVTHDIIKQYFTPRLGFSNRNDGRNLYCSC